MICVEVKASRDYEIRIESGSLKKAGEYIGQVVAGRHAVIVTDSTVKELYLDTVEESLSRASFQTDSFVIPSGEKSKDAAHYIQLLEFLAEKTVTRSDVLVALGGGVVGDLTVFPQRLF